MRKVITDARNLIATSFKPSDHLKAREILQSDPEIYKQTLQEAYLYNPFLKLTDDEVAMLKREVRIEAVGQLIALRHAATRAPQPSYVVFCMPKSGSSFIKSALLAALQLPFVSLTSVGAPRSSSEFGMNSREQELDELAIVKSAIAEPGGFIAQHHTRYTLYLALQMKLYGIVPIITIRNVLDCIVSFDDMVCEARLEADEFPWIMDSQFILPLNYKELDTEARYAILTHSYGVWLINFYLSWQRSRHHRLAAPLFIRYEDHVLDRETLIRLLSDHVSMSSEQEQRLRDFVHEPDKTLSRFNVGRSGRGAEKVPERLQAFLQDYAGMFRSQLSDEEIRYLVR